MQQKTFIYANIQKEGFHNFPEAATLPQFATGDKYDVSHLALRHMHYFFIKVWIEVTHSNRDVEFIQLRRRLEEYYGPGTVEFGSKSCEMIAEDLKGMLQHYYLGEIRIDVSEDNLNGAYVEFKQ
jgi:hypothetical protein